jgi:elongation factor P hydroxylase
MKTFKKYLKISLGISFLFFSQIHCMPPQMPLKGAAPATTPVVIPPAPAPVAVIAPPAKPVPPKALPVATPAAPAVAPTPAPAVTPPAPAPTPTPATPQATPPSAHEKEFDEIYKQLDQLNNLKKELKAQLSDAEDKLSQARKAALDSKKTSFEIFQKNNVADAEKLVAQVDKSLQDLKTLQKSLKEVTVPKFEGNIKKIEDLIKTVQSKISDLQTKGLKFQISQAEKGLQAQQAQKPEDVTIASGEQAGIKTEQTIWQKSYHTMVDWTAVGIKKVQKTWANFKNWVYSPKDDSSSEGKKNLKSVETKPQTVLNLTSEAALKSVISEIDGLIKQFDEIQISLNQKSIEIKLKIRNLENTIKSNPEIKKYFEKLREENPAWKNTIVNGFSSLVDVSYVLGKAVVKVSREIYSKAISPVVEDVKAKIKEEEKEKSPATPLTEGKVSSPTPKATEEPKTQIPLMPISPTK